MESMYAYCALIVLAVFVGYKVLNRNKNKGHGAAPDAGEHDENEEK